MKIIETPELLAHVVDDAMFLVEVEGRGVLEHSVDRTWEGEGEREEV